MKKALLLLLVLFSALPAFGQQVPRNVSIKYDQNGGLMGLGVPGELAIYLTANQWPEIVATPPTMAATPAPGVNWVQPGISIIPTAAAANSAAFVGAQTPVPGQEFYVFNPGANSVRLKAQAGVTLNGVTAGGYVVLPAKGITACRVLSLTSLTCTAAAVPTPAGP